MNLYAVFATMDEGAPRNDPPADVHVAVATAALNTMESFTPFRQLATAGNAVAIEAAEVVT